MKRSFVALGVAIATWSLSPLLIYESRGYAEPPILALWAVAIGSLLAALVLTVDRRRRVPELVGQVRRAGMILEAALVGLAAFVAYPLLYFSAIQGGPPVMVNLVNYLWPVVAVVVVAVARAADRSLETALAAGFGFAGAGLAITAGTGIGGVPNGDELHPFLLAGLGALVYGGASGAISLRHPTERPDSFAVFTIALLLGGLLSWTTIAAFAVIEPSVVALDVFSDPPWTLLAYALLLPVAHLSWMTAIRDPRVPAFPSAFLVPVISTGVLALVVSGVAKPEVLSALVLVLCGITFASVRERGVPVAYAVSLSMLASIQVSQVIAERVGSRAGIATATMSELIVAATAVFAGFILSNAIQRNGALHAACSRFYARAAAVAKENPGVDVLEELDVLDGTVIRQVDRPPRRRRGDAPPRSKDFAAQWADVDVAVSNRVSAYEWLVLLVGGGSFILALHAYAVESTEPVIILLRALTVSLVVGILFAIRDYDRHRPELLCTLLSSFRSCYGFAVGADSPLSRGKEYWSRGTVASVKAGLAALLLIGLCAIALNGPTR